MESEQDQRPSLKWKNDAVETFRVVSVGIPLTPQQAEWLMRKGVDTNRPAAEQQELLDVILAQAEIEVVEAVWSKTEREQLSADDKVFLVKQCINLEMCFSWLVLLLTLFSIGGLWLSHFPQHVGQGTGKHLHSLCSTHTHTHHTLTLPPSCPRSLGTSWVLFQKASCML